MKQEYNPWDKLYHQAKEEGYRSRAAYKLLELQKKYKLLRKGDSVLDMGCWPGGWTQVAAHMVGDGGTVVGVDLVESEPLPGVTFLTGDLRDEAIHDQLRALVPGGFHSVVSDMSPKLTGIREADEAGISACVELAGYLSEQQLKKGGNLAFKAFMNNDTERVIKELRKRFSKTIRTELEASRNTSNEFYVVMLEKK